MFKFGLGKFISEPIKDKLHAAYNLEAQENLDKEVQSLKAERDLLMSKLTAQANTVESCRRLLERRMIELETDNPQETPELECGLRDLMFRQEEYEEIEAELSTVETDYKYARRTLQSLRKQPNTQRTVSILYDLSNKQMQVPKRSNTDKRAEQVEKLLEDMVEKAQETENVLDNVPPDSSENKGKDLVYSDKMEKMLNKCSNAARNKINQKRSWKTVKSLPYAPSSNNNDDNDDNNDSDMPPTIDKSKEITHSNKENDDNDIAIL